MKTKTIALSASLLTLLCSFILMIEDPRQDSGFDNYDSEAIPYSQIKDSLKTGDVLLFDGFDLAGLGIMILENDIVGIPPYTHVGIVFRLPARDNMPAGLYFWQAAPPAGSIEEDGRFGNDYFKGVPGNGAQMISLDTLMNYVANLKGLNTLLVAARQLKKELSPEQSQALYNYAAHISGRSFSYPTDGGMVVDYLAGASGRQSGDESFFCSKLASQTFWKAGLIDSVVTNSVLPGDFAPIRDTAKRKVVFKIDNGFRHKVNPIIPE